MSSEDKIVPFGKYKGRPLVEVIETDPAYLQWLTAQDWFREKFVTLHQTIINRGAETEETPDHNALQVMFLDDGFRDRFIQALFKDSVCESDVEFEVGGVDVVLKTSMTKNEVPGGMKSLPHYYWTHADGSGESWIGKDDYGFSDNGLHVGLEVEIKPAVGDDYPAVLRQMKRNGSKILFLKNYAGQGATEDQFIKTFAASGFKVVFLRDCQ